MKKYLKWYLLAVMALAVVFVSAKPWNWANANADETIPITITKVWDDMNNADGSRPESIRMQVNQNGTPWRTVELTAADGSGNQWTKEITDAPLRDAAGNKYEYTLTEELPDGYESKIQKTEPEDHTQFTVEIVPTDEHPYVGDEFRYAITVKNDSTYDGVLSVAATLDNKVEASAATDNGTINGSTVEWTGIVIPSDGTKILYVTATASEEGDVEAQVQATINGHSATGSHTHDIQYVPELNVFRMEVSGAPDSVIADENATATWKVTVRGDEGAEYTVSLGDTDTRVVSGNLSGTIGKSNEAVITLSKTVTSVSGQGSVEIGCSATLQAKGKTTIRESVQTTVSGKVSVTVTEPEPEMLNVTWVDDDGITILDGPKTFEKGSTVPSTNVVPVKSEDSDNTYSFDKWIRSEDANGNITFKASYTATPKPSGPVNYTVKWYDENGSLFKSETRSGMIGEIAEVTEGDKTVDNKVCLESRSTTSATLTKDGGMLELYFIDFVAPVKEQTGVEKISDTAIKATVCTTFTNTSGIDVYGLAVKDVMNPVTGMTLTFGDYAVDGTSITPVTGGANDLIHEFKLLPDTTAFKAGQSVELTYTIIMAIDSSYAGGSVSGNVSATAYESPRISPRMMRMAPMALSSEREPIQFLVTNSHTPEVQEETTSVTITIDWDDEGNEDKRPASVDAYLLQDGNTLKTVTLNAENNWTATEDGLPLCDPDGYEYMYFARQVETPAGYKANVKKNGATITITNTYQAEVPAEYTVTYDLNGGTIPGAAEGFTYSNGAYSKTVQANSTRPDLNQEPTREHYVFKGWNPALSGTVTSDVTYKAVWEAETHTVTYKDGENGSVFSDYTTDAKYGDPTPDYPGVPEKEGYLFKGWSPAVAGTVSGDAVYTAQWEEKSPDVHVHTKGSETTIKEPTCTETGTKAFICSECGETYGEYSVAALGHTYGEEVISKEATCTEAGTKVYTCGRCGKIYDEQSIPAMGHTSNLNYTDKGDGTHAGSCNRCGEEVTAEAHTFGEWTESGDKMERECDVCGATEERVKNPEVKTYAVTYSMNGAISTKMYEDGTKILVEEGPGNNDGHFAGWTYDGREYHAGDTVVVNSDITFVLKVEAHTFTDHEQAGTCKEIGYSWKECTVCDYETDRVETGLGDHQVPDTWTDDCISHNDEHCEKHVKMCMVCNKSVDSEEHSYGEWATKTEGGYTVIERVCSCGHRQAVKAQSSVTATYNGKERPLLKTSNYEGIQANIHGCEANISYKDGNGTLIGDPKNAGKYTAVVTVQAGGEEIGSVEIAYEIEPAVLTAKYRGETIPVNGSFKGTVEVDGFMHDDTDMPDFEFPDIDVNGIDWSKPGTYTIKPYGGKVNDNYVFEYVEGTLTIVENNSTSVAYPGLEEDPTKSLVQETDMLNNGTKVIVDLDGGKWEPEDSFWKEVSGHYEYTLQKNDMATLYSNPTKDGNLFMGWKKAMNNNTVTYTAHWGEISVKTTGDVTYNGMTQKPEVTVTIHGDEIKADQFEITDYRDKDGKSLGTDVTDAPLLPKDAGTYTAEVAVKDALGAPVCVMDVEFTIKPAKLTVKTESANKEYDGKELTAGGSVEGLVNGETVTLKMTGTQTEKGSSKNTYEIEWGDVKASNYEITEEIGTLTVGTEGLPEDETVEIKASINWNDARDYNHLRPEDIDIRLYQNGKLYLTGNTNGDSKWEYTFKVDKADKDGKAYEYTVSVKTLKGYEAKVDDYTITLTHVPVTSVDITVTWNDKSNKDKVRPTEAELVIYQNDKAYRTVKVTQKGSWKLSVKDLPKFDDDNEEYTYSLGYDELPDGYMATFKGMSVTYTHEVKATSQTTTKPSSSSTTKPSSTSKPSSTTKPSSASKPSSTTKPNSTVSGNSVDKDKGEVVKTGENDFLLFSLLGLTALAGAGFVIYNKKRKNA